MFFSINKLANQLPKDKPDNLDPLVTYHIRK